MKINTPNVPVQSHKLKLFSPPSKIALVSGIVLLASTLTLLPTTKVNGQDPQFSQFFANPLYLNPAFAGSSKCPRLTMNYRNEWPSLSGTFVTSSAAYDQHVKALNGGLGVLVLSDQAGGGTLNTVSGSVLYSYYAKINNKWTFRAGFQAGYMQKRVDWEKLTFGDMIDPRYGFIYATGETAVNNSKGNLDIGVGALIYSKKFFGGFSAHHITQPTEGFIDQDNARLPMKISVHAGGVSIVEGYGEDLMISPNFIYQRQQDFQQLNFGFYLKKGLLYGGLWYRQSEKTSDSFIVHTGVEMGAIKMGYSYDITLSKLSNASGGSHELSATIQFTCRPKSPTYKPMDCYFQ